MKTFSATPEDIKRKWHLVDARGKTLGRLATEIAKILRGKHKPEYTPHMDMGDYVVVVNTDNLHFTGNKLQDKIYYKHTGYIGNLKSISLEKLVAKDSTIVLAKAVKGMLPKNSLGRVMFKKLKLYAQAEHKHQSQNPELLEVS